MGFVEVVKKVLPAAAYRSLASLKKKLERGRIARLPPLSEREFADILAGPLNLSTGDTVYVHSAVDQLSLGFPFFRILALLRDAVGPKGTLLFPSYPNRHISALEYVQQGHTFDVRRTPSYIGLLTEFARRRPGAIRSVHPIKSVCAAGPLAAELTSTHHLSPYPFDRPSPYYKMIECGAKIVGLGVNTETMTLMHAVEDAIIREGDSTVRVYAPGLFAARCLNYRGEELTVETRAHDPVLTAQHDVVSYIKNHFAPADCEDLTIRGMRFFRADAALLFHSAVERYRRGIIPYTNPDTLVKLPAAGRETS